MSQMSHECFADEIAIDFPSVGNVVDRMRSNINVQVVKGDLLEPSSLRAAFELFILHFPVYRTYLTASGPSGKDRAIIEEAAGITKFKTKRRLSEAKLESSKLNLSRVNDIVVEVEKQLGSLKRQAAKARRSVD